VLVESATVVITRNENMKIAVIGHQKMRANRSLKDIFILKDKDVLIIPGTLIWCSNTFMMCVNFLCAVTRFVLQNVGVCVIDIFKHQFIFNY
jgi:hypothetical protein